MRIILPRQSHIGSVIKNLVFLILPAFLLLITGSSPAQTLSLSTQFRSDDIPANIQRLSSSLLIPFAGSYSARIGYRYYRVHEEAFNGIPELRKYLHTVTAGAEARFPEQGIELAGEAMANSSPDAPPTADYLMSAQYTHHFAVDPTEGTSITASIRGEAARYRETSVATAVGERISYRELALQVELDWWNSATLAGKVIQQRYSDENMKHISYGYLLFHLGDDPKISLGYAYAWSNSLFDNWRLTDTKRIAFDPITRVATYQYYYFYYPYFTPRKEHGHMFIGIVQWQAVDHLLFYAKATVPFSSGGLLKYFPSTGTTPAPIDYGAYYNAEDLQPKQYEASIISDVLEPLTMRLDFEYFEKPYYLYRGIGMNLQYVFN